MLGKISNQFIFVYQLELLTNKTNILEQYVTYLLLLTSLNATYHHVLFCFLVLLSRFIIFTTIIVSHLHRWILRNLTFENLNFL